MARTGKNGVFWYSDTLSPALKAGPANLDRLIGSVMEYEATNGQNWMRTNARWVDRTGNARQGLFARAGRETGQHYIVLYHTMPYGVWLELRHSGKYAIIEPAMESVGRDVMSSLRGLMNRLDRAA